MNTLQARIRTEANDKKTALEPFVRDLPACDTVLEETKLMMNLDRNIFKAIC